MTTKPVAFILLKCTFIVIVKVKMKPTKQLKTIFRKVELTLLKKNLLKILGFQGLPPYSFEMMIFRKFSSFFIPTFGLIFFASCANPVNRVTSDRYMDQCHEAERNGQLAIAEQACYRSLVNVDMGNLGQELKSQRLYNLGRIKRRLGKFEEAGSLFQESLEIEENLSGPGSGPIARRLTELALTYLQASRISDGIPLVQRLGSMTQFLSESERNVVGKTFLFYAKELQKQNKPNLVIEFSKKAELLGFKSNTF